MGVLRKTKKEQIVTDNSSQILNESQVKDLKEMKQEIKNDFLTRARTIEVEDFYEFKKEFDAWKSEEYQLVQDAK